MTDKNLTSKDEAASVSEVRRPLAPREPFSVFAGVLLNVIIFSVIGPIFGGLLFSTLLMATESISFLVVVPLTYLFISPLAVPVAYYQSGVAPALTGIVVAIATAWLPKSRCLYVIAAIAGGLLSAILIAQGDTFKRSNNPTSEVLILFISGSLAAIICTRIARPFRLGAPTESDIQSNGPVGRS